MEKAGSQMGQKGGTGQRGEMHRGGGIPEVLKESNLPLLTLQKQEEGIQTKRCNWLLEIGTAGE